MIRRRNGSPIAPKSALRQHTNHILEGLPLQTFLKPDQFHSMDSTNRREPGEGAAMSIAHPRLRCTGGLLLFSLGLAGCGLITGNEPEASTVVISPSGITFDAIGATTTLSAEVRDQNDQILGDAVVTWSSSNPNVATISPAGLVTAVTNGTATITAAAGAASGSVNLSVTQLASMLEKVSGDGQLGPAGEPLPESLTVQVHDRLGNPAIGVPVEFQIIEGGGTPTPAQTQTDVQGRASTTWTLGAVAGEAQAVRSFLSFSVGQGVNFEATAVPGLPGGIVVVSGDGQAAPQLSTLLDPLAVRVEDLFQNPVSGVTVEFAVIGGGGSVQPSTTSTDAGGLATTHWTLGAPLGDQSVSIMVAPILPTTVSAFATTIPELVQILGGDGQIGIVGERLLDPLSVRVLGPGGAPVSSLDVDFSVSANGGFLESMDGTEVSPNLTVRTDAMGDATVGGWILGPTPGTPEVTVEVPGLAPVVLTATAETGPPALLVKVSGDQQSGLVGTLLDAPLVVRVTDTQGNPVAGSTITFGAASGDGSVFPTQVTSDSNGTAATDWTLGSSQGSQSVGASIEAGAMVTFTATATDENGGLAIELLFIDQPTALQRQAFDDAVSRWAALIPGKLEPVPVNLAAGACRSNSPAINQVVDDLLVLVSLEFIDGVGGTLGSAGVCSVRQFSNGLPIVANLRLDTGDLGLLEGTTRLVDLILHELGHALGFGTLWASKGFLENPSLVSPGADTHFDGPSAVTAFDAIGGDVYTGGQKVPVENEEGSVGSRDSHWRLAVFSNELMTPLLVAAGANPLSRVTVASFGDLGYVVDEGAADTFQLNLLAAPSAVGEEVEMFPLGDDIWRGTIYLLDEEGRIRGVLQ